MGTMFANDQKSLITNLPLSFECSYPQFFLSLVSTIFLKMRLFQRFLTPVYGLYFAMQSKVTPEAVQKTSTVATI